VPKRIEFRDLQEPHCKLLYAIWQIQNRHPSVGATAARIMEITGFRKSKFTRYLHDLRDISQSFYVLTVKGRKPVRYRLAKEHLVTQSDTAAILLQFLSYSPKSEGERVIPLEKFAAATSRALGLPPSAVKTRLKKAAEKHYLTEIRRDQLFLEVNERLLCEEGFLRLLADHYVGKSRMQSA